MNYRSKTRNQAVGLILLGMLLSLTAIVSLARADEGTTSPALSDTNYRTAQVMPFSLHTNVSFFNSKALELNALNAPHEYRARYGLVSQSEEAAYVEKNSAFQAHLLQEIGDGELRFYSKRVENKLKDNRDLVFVGRYMGYVFAAYLFANGQAIERNISDNTSLRVQSQVIDQKLPIGPQASAGGEKANVQLKHLEKNSKVTGSVGYGLSRQAMNTSVSRELITNISMTLAHQQSLAKNNALTESRGSLDYSLTF